MPVALLQKNQCNGMAFASIVVVLDVLGRKSADAA